MRSFSVAAALLMTVAPAFAEMSFDQQYPGPWREDPRADIIMTLAHAKARGCGEFYYRPYVESHADAPEFLVYCTRDGENWTAWIVWPAIDRADGPARISDLIPPPY